MITLLEMFGAAHHTKPLPPPRALNPRPRTYPTSLSFRQRSPPLLRSASGSIHPAGAGSFMPPGVGASYIVVIQQTSGEVLAIGEENSYASRLWSLEEFSLFFPLLA